MTRESIRKEDKKNQVIIGGAMGVGGAVIGAVIGGPVGGLIGRLIGISIFGSIAGVVGSKVASHLASDKSSILNKRGCDAYQARNYVSALDAFTEASERGNSVALRNIGVLYEQGQGVMRNIVTAQEYYQKALEAKYDAKKDIDRIKAILDGRNNYEHGNFTAAKADYEKAKNAGSAEASRHLGVLYQQGKGVEQNFIEAAKYYLQAVEKGYECAREDFNFLFNNNDLSGEISNSTGDMYYKADGVKQDYVKAFTWYNKAKEKGSAYACYSLGLLYGSGDGVVGGRDIVKAAEHYLLAATRGYEKIKVEEALHQLFRDVKTDDLDSVRVIVAHFVQQNEQTLLLSFKTSNGQTLLHFASLNGCQEMVERLVPIAITTNRIEEYILATDSQGQTALMLAVTNEHLALIPLLIEPVMQERMRHPMDHVSNHALLTAIEEKRTGVSERLPPARVATPRVTEVAVAQEYLENGLTDQQALQIHRIFKPEQFKLVMTQYKDNISVCEDKRQRKILCKESTRLMLAKYKYDQIAAIHSNETKALSMDVNARTHTAINILQSFLGNNLAEYLGKYSAYFDEIKLFLNFIQELVSNNTVDTGKAIENFVNKHSDSYIVTLSIAFDLYFILKNEKYDQLFHTIVTLIRFFANKFDNEQEKILAEHLCLLMSELYVKSDDENTFLNKTWRFYDGLNEPAAKCAVEILGCKKAVSNSIDKIKTFHAAHKIKQAKAQFSKLVAGLIKYFHFYSEEVQVENFVEKIINALSLEDIVKQKGYGQFWPIILVFKEVNAQLPSESLGATITLLNQLVNEFYKHEQKQQTAKIIIYLKLFLRLLIEYATIHKNKIFSYVGVVGLGIVQLFDARDVLQVENSVLAIINTISREFVGFLRDTSGIINIFEIDGLKISAVIINALVSIINGITCQEQADLSACLQLMKISIERADADIGIFLRHDPNNRALKTAKKCFSVASTCVMVGNTVKVIYDVFNGNALKELHNNLQKYLPEDVASSVETGLLTVLQGFPVVGGLAATLSVHADMKAVEKSIIAHINEAGQNIGRHLDKVSAQLSNQIHLGFTILDRHLFEITNQLEGMQEDLAQIKIMLLQQQKILQQMLFDFKLVGPIAANNKYIKDKIESRHINSEKNNSTLIKLYDKSLSYLLPGSTYEDAINTVYSEYFNIDWLGVLSQFSSKKYQASVGAVVFPNFNMWLQTISTLIQFVAKLQEEDLFKSGCFNIDGLLKVFYRSIDIIKFLQYLTTQEFITDIFSVVREREVNLRHLGVLGYYCSLIGVPLVGFGEDVKFWYSNTDACFAWREAMVRQISQIVRADSRRTVISDAMSTTHHVVFSLGYLLMVVSECLGNDSLHDKSDIQSNVVQKLYEICSDKERMNKEYFYRLYLQVIKPSTEEIAEEFHLEQKESVSPVLIDKKQNEMKQLNVPQHGQRYLNKVILLASFAIIGFCLQKYFSANTGSLETCIQDVTSGLDFNL